MADINAAFGGGLNQSLSSPQGQLATSIAAIIGSCNDSFVNLTNQMNPAFADRHFQDAIAELYFLFREGSTATVVRASLRRSWRRDPRRIVGARGRREHLR